MHNSNLNTNKPIKNLLHDKGCKNIEHYDLINNSGYSFTYKNVKYDLRFWRNCYGTSPMLWNVMTNEERINKLYQLILTKKEKFTNDTINVLNITGFLYSVGKLNTLQVASKLTLEAIALGFKVEDIVKELE